MSVKSPTILVIDDEAVNIHIAAEILGGSYRILGATDGEEGLRVARAVVPDLVLLDVKMPGMDGYEVCARLLGDPLTEAVSVVFVTAMDSTAQELRGLDAGAVDYLAKPLEPEIVKARVRNHLDLRRKMRQPHVHAPEGGAQAQGITPRQKQILEWIQAGKTNDEIATIIGSSVANVKYHIGQVMKKLDAYNRTQLISKAISLRVIPPGK